MGHCHNMPTIEKRGRTTFRAKVRRKGQPALSATFSTRHEAVAWARDIESRMDKGAYAPEAEQGDSTTLAEALDRYRREVTPGKKGEAQERRRIDAWKAHPLARLRLANIRGTDLAAYRDQRLADGKSPDTVRLELAIISHLYRIAVTEWGMTALTNPVKNIRKPSASKGRARRLLEGEEEALLAKAGSPLREAIILLMETAIRRGELVSIKRRDIDKERAVLVLHDSKNGDRRDVPMSTRALAALESMPARIDGTLLGEPKAAADWLSHAFIKLTKACGIEGLRLHDLRHEAASRLFEKGLNPMEVASVTGHKTLAMLKRYTHLQASELARRLG